MTTGMNLPQQFRLSKRNQEKLELYCDLRRYLLARKGGHNTVPYVAKVSEIIFHVLGEAILRTVSLLFDRQRIRYTADDLRAIARGVHSNTTFSKLTVSLIMVTDWPQQIRLSKRNRESLELYCELRREILDIFRMHDDTANADVPNLINLALGDARMATQDALCGTGSDILSTDDEATVVRKLANRDRRSKQAKRRAAARVAVPRDRTVTDRGASEDRPSPPETHEANNDAAMNTASRIDNLIEHLEGLRPIAEEYDRQRQKNGLKQSAHMITTVIRNEIRNSHDHIRSSIKSLQLDLELEALEEAAAGGRQR